MTHVTTANAISRRIAIAMPPVSQTGHATPDLRTPGEDSADQQESALKTAISLETAVRS